MIRSHADCPAGTRPAVLVLAALHQYHDQVCCYRFAELRKIVAGFAPDLLFAEVREDDLRGQKPERVKREYPEAIYPLLKEIPLISACALEPSGEVREKLINRFLAGEEKFGAAPEFREYETAVRAWFQASMGSWKTAGDVNSRMTDDSVREKRARDRQLYPRDYSLAHDAWNEFFLARILDGIHRDKPRRVLVLVGLEHCYWLRDNLRERDDVQMLEADEVIDQVLRHDL